MTTRTREKTVIEKLFDLRRPKENKEFAENLRQLEALLSAKKITIAPTMGAGGRKMASVWKVQMWEADSARQARESYYSSFTKAWNAINSNSEAAGFSRIVDKNSLHFPSDNERVIAESDHYLWTLRMIEVR